MEIRNLTPHKRGDTYMGAEFTLSYSDGSHPDLTGASIVMKFRKRNAPNKVYTFSTATGELTITDEMGAKFTIDEQVIAWDSGLYDYDVQITFASGYVDTPVGGRFQIEQDVTY